MTTVRHRARPSGHLVRPVGHDALAHDLARWLRVCRYRATWERVNMCRPHDMMQRLEALRERWGVPTGRYGFEADVYSIVMTGRLQRVNPAAYEVKVTREDFRREIRDGKWVGMCLCADKAYFAVPEGLVEPEEIPRPCGLVVRRWDPSCVAYTWRVAKSARSTGLRGVEPSMLLKLALLPFWGRKTDL